MLNTILLAIHIFSGAVALLAALVALVTAKGRVYHVWAGRVYALGMTSVFITALPLAFLGADWFLLFIAFFSFYLVFAGWRFARNRRGQPHSVDWAAVVIMGLTGLGMEGYAVVKALDGDSQWVTLTLFGAIALVQCVTDGFFYRSSAVTAVKYAKRISRHLTNMLAGTIATVTAVLVVNVDTNPVWIVWIAPTIAITPLIVWWNLRVMRQSRGT